MMQTRIAVFGLASLTVLFMAGSSFAASLTLAHSNAVGSQITDRADAFTECVKQSGTELTLQHLPAAQLGTDKEVIEQIKMGAVDMTITDTAFLAELEPRLGVFQLPFMFKDWDHAERAMTGKAGKILAATLAEKQGMTTLAFMHNGFRNLLTRDVPVRGLEDMKKIQFRSPPLPLWLTMFDRLGVQPVTVPWNDVYTAMQTGLVDGVETTSEGMVNSKIFEVGKYVTLSGHMYSLNVMVAATTSLARLNDKQIGALKGCAARFQENSNVAVRKLADVALDTMRKAGLEIIEIDKAPFQNALKPAWTEMVGKGPEVTAIIDAIASAQ